MLQRQVGRVQRGGEFRGLRGPFDEVALGADGVAACDVTRGAWKRNGGAFDFAALQMVSAAACAGACGLKALLTSQITPSQTQHWLLLVPQHFSARISICSAEATPFDSLSVARRSE